MATTKCTLFAQIATAVSTPFSGSHRIGGWSESYYFPGDVPAALAAFVQGPLSAPGGLCALRAALLPQGGAIVGQRLQLVSPSVGPSQSLGFNFPGTAGLTDSPQQAMLLKLPGTGVANVRRLILRGIPDINIVEGEYSATPYFTNALNQFTAGLSAFVFRGRDLSQPTTKILTITALGVVTTETNTSFSVPSMVRILKSRDSGGNLRGGRFQVTTVGPLSTQFTILNWPFGATTGGSVRLDAIIFPSISSGAVPPGRIITRRVGRPFVQFRGRRSRRRL